MSMTIDPGDLAVARKKAGLFFSTFGSHDATPITFTDGIHEYEMGPDLEPINIRPRREDAVA